jgi:nucleotide-binding universal stress UspA family protein
MFRSVLLPLDRSSDAEQALPLALSIARRADARLDLVEVHSLYALDSDTAGLLPFEPARDAERKQQEQLYLDATARCATCVSPVSITASVLNGSSVLAETVADAILERARTVNADLIIMTTHGRGALGRFGIRSVADEIIRRAGIPVLLLRRGDKSPGMIAEPVLDNILIPLDGSELAEQVLEPAMDLARLMEARCSLLRVVESAERAQAETYLEQIAARMRERGLQVGTHAIVARRAVDVILKEAKAQSCSLIALATHGRGGFKRLLLGSMADKLIRTAASPVLVCRTTGYGLAARR